MQKKVWCEVWDGAIYNDRCLYKMNKMAKENKSCANCVCYENLLLREKLDLIRSPKRTGRKEKQKVKSKEAREPIQGSKQDQFYTSEELINLVGKSLRRIQFWAQAGRIPAQKIGPHWHFPKEKINRWLEERKKENQDEPGPKPGDDSMPESESEELNQRDQNSVQAIDEDVTEKIPCKPSGE